MRIDNLEDENECLRDMLNDIAYALGLDMMKVRYRSEDNYTGCQIAVLHEIECRLMPVGMNWPRFDDGEPVRFGDEFATSHDECSEVAHITFVGANLCERAPHGFYTVINSHGHDASVYYEGQRVKRLPILAKGGKPIEVGQTLYGEDGRAWHVCALHPGERYEVESDSAPSLEIRADGTVRHKRLKANWLTHEKPILAADGKPIKIGSTLYSKDGRDWHVLDLRRELLYPVKAEGPAIEGEKLPSHAGRITKLLRADLLTHEKPDTWDSFEHDLFIELSDKSGYSEDVRKNAAAAYVDRAKKLAGGGGVNAFHRWR